MDESVMSLTTLATSVLRWATICIMLTGLAVIAKLVTPHNIYSLLLSSFSEFPALIQLADIVT
jgi:hypothetical protein